MSHVTVTEPRHALYGQRLPVLTIRSGRGPTFLVVALPDGRRRSIRRASTDLAREPTRDDSAAQPSRVSARTLLPLAHHLSALLTLCEQEVRRDGSPSDPGSDHTPATPALAEPHSRDTAAGRSAPRHAAAPLTARPARPRRGEPSC
ncbi:DUF5372 family protein [Methylobacterium sp. DCY52]|uniref:DUF5372 family protein n=1 Tax=Methylobacterium sp. DCY52 TaxID=739139 RepID=UPI00406C6423